MVEGAMSVVQCLLFGIVVMLASSGIAILVGGVLLHSMYHSYGNFVDSKLEFIPIALISLGVIVFFVAAFGCSATAMESAWMIATFSILLLLVSIVEVAGVIVACLFHPTIDMLQQAKMIESMESYNSNPDVKDDWDILQHDKKCCGVEDKEDWTSGLPLTCCVILVNESCIANNSFHKGCWNAIKEPISRNILIYGIVALGMTFIQFLGVTFACCLACSIADEYY